MFKILKIIVGSIVVSCPFLAAGLIISYFIDSTLGSLGTIFFIMGGVLIVFFAPGLFSSSSSGTLHTPVVIYRLVNTLSRKNRTTQNGTQNTMVFFSSLNLVLVGVILWVVSYFV